MAPLKDDVSFSSSEFETQFVPQSGDEDVLWEVLEITAEKGRQYRVRWAGKDPDTGKAYPQSWVDKHDCTDDLVRDWKIRKKKRSGGKTANKRSTTSRSSNTASTVTRRPRQPSAGPSTLNNAVKNSVTSKRKRSTSDATDHSLPPVSEILDKSPRPKKKRKTTPVASRVSDSDEEQPSYDIRKLKGRRKPSRQIDTDEESEEEGVKKKPFRKGKVKVAPDRRANKGKGKARYESPDLFDSINGEGSEHIVDDRESTPPPSIIKIGPPIGMKKISDQSRKSASHSASSSHKMKTPLLLTSNIKKGNSYREGTGNDTQFASDADDNLDIVEPSEDMPEKRAFRSCSSSSEHSPLLSRQESKGVKRRRHPLSVNHAGDVSESYHSPSSSTLSSVARQRLELFDADMAFLEPPDLDIQQDHPTLDVYAAFDMKNDFGVPVISMKDTVDSNHLESNDLFDPDDGDIPLPPSLTVSQLNVQPIRIVGEAKAPPNPSPGDDSIVPETETQSSTNSHPQNTQSQDNPSNPAPAPGSPDPKAAPSTRPPLHRTPSLVSRMKPNMLLKARPLRPLDVMTASAFRQYVSPLRTVDIDYLPSSIETFGSPEKGAVKLVVDKQTDAQDTNSDSDGNNAVIRARGQDLANRAASQREQQRKAQNKEKAPMRTLSNLLRDQVKKVPSSEMTGVPSADLRVLPSPVPFEAQDNSIPLEGASKSAEADQSPEAEDEIVREMEDAFVDLSGGTGAKGVSHKSAPVVSEEAGSQTQEVSEEQLPRECGPQEEEESTQDLLVQEENIQLSSDAEGLPLNRAPDNSQTSGVPTAADLPPLGVDEPIEDLKTELKLQAEQIESLNRRLTESLASADVKSDEVLRLEKLLEEQNTKINEMTASSLTQSAMLQAAAEQLTSDLNKTREETEQLKTSWDSERAILSASIDALTQAKQSAENDRDFFREQYVQASGFVSSVRLENAELEKKVAIAEGQTKNGLTMIRTMFEGRVKKLEAEVNTWKGTVRILEERDKRAEGANMRRLAAEAPELKSRNASLEADVNDLEEAVAELNAQVDALKMEKYVLLAEKQSWVRATQGTNIADPTTTDETKGFWCRWRPGGASSFCETVVSSYAELALHWEEHMQQDALEAQKTQTVT